MSFTAKIKTSLATKSAQRIDMKYPWILKILLYIIFAFESFPFIRFSPSRNTLFLNSLFFYDSPQDLHTVDLEEFKYGGTNITAFRLVDPDNYEMEKIVRDWSYGERYGRKLDIKPHSIKVRASFYFVLISEIVFLKIICMCCCSHFERKILLCSCVFEEHTLVLSLSLSLLFYVRQCCEGLKV